MSSILAFICKCYEVLITMVSNIIRLPILFLYVTQAFGQEARSIILTKLVNARFQCMNTTCSPLYTLTVSTILNCEIACLRNVQCHALSFHSSSSACALFNNAPNATGNMLVDVDMITMIIISGTRMPPGKPISSMQLTACKCDK